MKNNSLLEVSLPTINEQKIISFIGKSKRDNRNKAQILAFTNSLVLAKTDVEKNQLYAMLLKDYILNSYYGEFNKIDELDSIIKSIDIENESLAEDNICLLKQYLDVDDKTRFKLASSFVNTLSQKNNRYKGIRDEEQDACIKICNNLNRVIESKEKKNNYVRTFRKVSSR